MDQFVDQLTREMASFLPRAGVAIFVFLLFWAATIVADRFFQRFRERASPNKRQVFTLINQTVKMALLLLGGVTALGTIGSQVGALVAGLGLTGFAVGFALKDALSNLLAGVLILLYRPFQPGDRINVTGLEGIVMEIDFRYTTLDSGDKRYLIPNASLFTNPIIISEPHPPPRRQQSAINSSTGVEYRRAPRPLCTHSIAESVCRPRWP
jgi:small-conductance mechanosensitive channel